MQKKSLSKTFFAFVFILFTACSLCFSYDFAGGTGEPNDPYQIETAAQLLQIGSDANLLVKCFILNNDIDLDPNVTGIPPFTQAPIAPDINNLETGFQGTSFSGIFVGNEHTISHLIIDTNGIGNDYLGLFGYLDTDSNVENLKMENVNIVGGDDSKSLGGLCGINGLGTIINNCYSTGSIIGGNNSSCLGVLCGANMSFSTINNCRAKGSVTGGNDSKYLGGLCGHNKGGTITDSFSTGNVTGGEDSQYLGGLCGYNNAGTILGCFSTSSVKGGDGSYCLGGLCGNYSNGASFFTGEISNCYSTGSVSGSSAVGGLCGWMRDARIYSCFSSGPVTDVNGSFGIGGGLCGFAPDAYIYKCYFLDTAGPDNGIGTPLTDNQMKQQASFSWNFINTWAICEWTNYPRLQWQILPADFLCPDGVDFLDYAHFSYYWLNEDCADSNDCEGADFDLSGCVDGSDLKSFTDFWLKE